MDTQGIKIKVHARSGSIATADAVNCHAQPTACCGAAEFVREKAPS
jgi:hypothetical protein